MDLAYLRIVLQSQVNLSLTCLNMLSLFTITFLGSELDCSRQERKDYWPINRKILLQCYYLWIWSHILVRHFVVLSIELATSCWNWQSRSGCT